MKTSLSVLFIVSALCFSNTTIEKSDNTDPEYRIVPFVSMKNLPIISGYINGKKVYFLVDSGSSMTILDARLRKKLDFKLITANNQDRATGIGGNKRIFNAFGVELKLGEIPIVQCMRAMDMTGLVEHIKENTSYEISGIIGSDTMKNYNIILDYGNEVCRIGNFD